MTYHRYSDDALRAMYHAMRDLARLSPTGREPHDLPAVREELDRRNLRRQPHNPRRRQQPQRLDLIYPFIDIEPADVDASATGPVSRFELLSDVRR